MGLEIKTNKGFVKIDKCYKIKFPYAGVQQTAEFYEVKGELWRPSLNISWSKGDTPDVSGCKTIDEVLEKIKSVAYGNRAEIDTINDMPVFYYNKENTRNLVGEIGADYEAFVKGQAKKFFDAEIKPLMIKNKWKLGTSHIGMLVLIAKYKADKYGDKHESGEAEWDNVRDRKKEFEFEYLCKKFLKAVGALEEESFIVQKFFNVLDMFNTKEFEKLYVKL